MDQRTTQMLFALLRSAICGTKLTEKELDSYSPELLQSLLKISSHHDLIHLLAYGLKLNDLVPEENTEIEKFIFKAVYRYECLKYEYDNICEALEKAHIPFLPLKGSVIRKYYPEPWMRTSCDIDILIHEKDIAKAKDALEDTLKYSPKGIGNHDVSFLSPNGVHFELHYKLLHSDNEDKYLKNIWEYARLKNGSEYEYELSKEMFYYYHVYHMAKHFVGGGCGIKPFVDMWIMNSNGRSIAGFKHLPIKKTRLYRFAEESARLCGVWFGQDTHTDLTENMQKYIIFGGVYGNIKNKLAANAHTNTNKLGYFLSRIWLPVEILKLHYPEMKDNACKPLYQFKRWGKVLFSSKTRRTRNTHVPSVNRNADVEKMIKKLKL